MYQSINPATAEVLAQYPQMTDAELQQIIDQADQAQKAWRKLSYAERALPMRRLAELFLAHAEEYGTLISQEMGKVQKEAVAEVKKCASVCQYYADNTEALLADQILEAGFQKALIHYQPLGVIMAIMPWNFPFWQVLRFLAPNLMVGNAGLLKHAPNVFGSALAIEKLVREAGFPEHLFRSVLIEPNQVGLALENPKLKGITLTGSEGAGMAVASKAGRELKKSVMELGGSDPFIVLADAVLEQCCQTSVVSRCFNAGQVCISAKRFIVHESLYEDFIERHKVIMENLKVGNPLTPGIDMGPIARPDLLEEVERLVQQSIAEGARLVTGGKRLPGPGNFYTPTLLADVTPQMTCFQKEIFGPVSSICSFQTEDEAIALANSTPYGLGASLWSQDTQRAFKLAQEIESGQVFINGMTVSHPALPFGGVKRSGYGRECSKMGLTEFANIKTIVLV